MTATRTPEQEAQAQQLAADIRAQADEVLREVAQLLNDTPDKQLFGDTEFAVRKRIMQLVARSFTARLAQKKRLRRLRHRLPEVQANRRLPRLPPLPAAKLGRPRPLRTRLLLLRQLRPGNLSVG